jgi:hypothetical protein
MSVFDELREPTVHNAILPGNDWARARESQMQWETDFLDEKYCTS